MTRSVTTFDWDASPLGVRADWPATLRSLTDLMLASIQPTVVAWGEGRISFYNDAFAAILGDKAPSAFGRPFSEVWSKIAADGGALLENVFAGVAGQTDDITVALDGGRGPEHAHFSFSYTPVRDESGAFAGLFGVCRDTTDQVLAQRVVEGERRRQQSMLQQLPGFAAVLAGSTYTFQYWNDAFIRLGGHEIIFGKPIIDIFPNLEGQEFVELLDDVFKTGKPFSARSVPLQFHSKLHPQFIDLIIQPIRDDADKIIAVFVGGYDVSVAEHSTRALRKSENLLAGIVASSDDAIISKTLDGLVTSWNAGAERLFGYSAQEAIGKPVAILAVPGHEQEMPEILARLRQGERIEHFETARRRKDGSIAHVSLTVSPIHDENGRVIGASKTARDISAAREAAFALKQTQDRVQEQHRELLHAARLGELGQMAATLAHEINQPLSAIINYLHATARLLDENDPDRRPMIDEGVRRAMDQAVRAAEIVRRLQTLAKPGEGLRKAEQINQILEEIAALAAIDAGRRGVKVTLRPDSACNFITVDRIEIQQVLLNLIRNSLDAMEGQPVRELTLSARSTEKTVEVGVADTGRGLEPGVKARLFQPFVTTKGNGMGIGLSICRRIIEAYNGSLRAEDAPSGGAVFSFALPRTHPPDAVAPAPISKLEAAGLAS